jgi:two-component sensor histidine kinase
MMLPVVEPALKGFGSKLIAAAFAQNASHVAEIKYLPAGIEFHVRFPVTERVAKRQ